MGTHRVLGVIKGSTPGLSDARHPCRRTSTAQLSRGVSAAGTVQQGREVRDSQAKRRANELWLETIIWQLKEGHIASQIVRTRSWDNRVLTYRDGILCLDGNRRYFMELVAPKTTPMSGLADVGAVGAAIGDSIDIDDPSFVGQRAGSKIFPSHTDRESQEWIERKVAELSLASREQRAALAPGAPAERGGACGTKEQAQRHHDVSEQAKSTSRKRRRQPPTFVRVAPHPTLAGQFGVFSTEVLQSGDIVYREKIAVVTAVPGRLVGTDHYIAYTRQGRPDVFLILKDDTLQASITYNLNSAAGIPGQQNELDPLGRGANVDLRVSDINLIHGSCYLTARCIRRIKGGDEVLWAYDVQASPDRAFAEPSDGPSLFEVVVAPMKKRPQAQDARTRRIDAPPTAAPTTSADALTRVMFARDNESPQSVASELGLCVDSILAESTQTCGTHPRSQAFAAARHFFLCR